MRERIKERRKCCELHGWCEGSLRRMISLENKYFIDFSLDSSAGTWRALARTVCYTTIREAAPRKAPHFFVSRLPWRAFSLTKVFFQRERVSKRASQFERARFRYVLSSGVLGVQFRTIWRCCSRTHSVATSGARR